MRRNAFWHRSELMDARSAHRRRIDGVECNRCRCAPRSMKIRRAFRSSVAKSQFLFIAIAIAIASPSSTCAASSTKRSSSAGSLKSHFTNGPEPKTSEVLIGTSTLSSRSSRRNSDSRSTSEHTRTDEDRFSTIEAISELATTFKNTHVSKTIGVSTKPSPPRNLFCQVESDQLTIVFGNETLFELRGSFACGDPINAQVPCKLSFA
jgi:hypothetical protein